MALSEDRLDSAMVPYKNSQTANSQGLAEHPSNVIEGITVQLPKGARLLDLFITSRSDKREPKFIHKVAYSICIYI